MTLWSSSVCKGELEQCRKILETDPDHLGALEIAAQAYWYEENYREVVQLTSRLIRLHPHEPGYRYMRGMAYLSMDRLKLAETDFKQALVQSNDFKFCEQVRMALTALEGYIDSRNQPAPNAGGYSQTIN